MARASLLLFISVLVPADAQGQGNAPAPVEVVRTFGELARRPALLLKEGTRVHLGLETARVPRDSALLVYALVKGQRWSGASGEALGPLGVECERRVEGRVRERLESMRAIRDRVATLRESSLHFFAATVSVGRPGEYALKLRDSEGKVIAEATIEATEEREQPWLMLTSSAQLEEQALERLLRENEPARAALTLSPGHVGLARCDGGHSLPSSLGPNGEGTDMPLPRWKFGRAPGVALTASPRSLELSFKNPMELIETQERLLVRVWVNQKPFMPREREAEEVLRKAVKTLESSTTRLVIDLDFNPARFGAKKGDRVALQVLYCPDGAELFQEGERKDRMAKARKESTDQPRLPLLSNKAEFVVR